MAEPNKLAGQLVALEPTVFDFDLEQTGAERDDMYSALAPEDTSALGFAFANALLAGCRGADIARHVGKPARHFMATRDEVDEEDVSGVDYYIRKMCLMWQLRRFRSERGALYDFCGWVDDGGIGGAEVGAGVLGTPVAEGGLAYTLVFINRDGVLDPVTPSDAAWVGRYQKTRA